MRTSALPEATRRVLERACRVADLATDHLLIGGTAMTLHVAHRVSEDLDFVQFGKELDRARIERILTDLRGVEPPELVTSLVARQHFDNEGYDIDDVHQDWMVDGVKVTFFCPDRREELDVLRKAVPEAYGAVPVADLDTIFRLKAMVVAERWTSRDAFDLLHFVERQGHGMSEIDEALRIKRPHYPFDNRMGLLTRPFTPFDPGFQSIGSDGPQTMAELAERMKATVDRYVRETKKAALSSVSKGMADLPPPDARDSSRER